jgi:hypothetical protein
MSRDVYVWFGRTVATTLLADSSTVIVRTPAHVAGTVDVTIYKDSGASIVLPQAYTFADDAPASPPGGSTPPSQGTNPPPGETSPPPDTTSPPPGTTSPPPGATTPPPASDPGDGPAPAVRQPGEVYIGARGLKLAVLGPDHPLARLDAGAWRRSACRTSPCAGLPLAP